MKFYFFSESFLVWLQKNSIAVLRVSLGIVFLWFGALKIFGVTPVAELVQSSYPFFPYPAFIVFLGIWETVIGLGLMSKTVLHITIPLMWLQMLGTFGSLLLLPSLFFNHGNVFLLTTEGEFVMKNLVLVAASLVIAGYQIKKEA